MKLTESVFIPDALKKLPVWCLWRIEDRNGQETKVPYSARYNGRASSTNSGTWDTYQHATEKWQSNPSYYRGLGVMIAPEYKLIFIDIDHCVDQDGEVDDRATDILNSFHESYAEISQSGSGLHILTLGEIPKNFKNSANGVEMYFQKRFCAFTGRCVMHNEPHSEPSGVLYVFNRYKTPDREVSRHSVPTMPLLRDDQRIIELASKREKRFIPLFKGDWGRAGYKSQSEADLALNVLLCFWTDGDQERMDRIFRSSGLYREKWERSDYRQRTLDLSCSKCTETLCDYIRLKEQKEMEDYEKAFAEWDHL